MSKPIGFGLKRSRVRGTGSSFRTPFTSVDQMQLQRSNFVDKCIMDGYCLRIKNYAGMQRVSRNIISCEKNHPHLHYVGAYLHSPQTARSGLMLCRRVHEEYVCVCMCTVCSIMSERTGRSKSDTVAHPRDRGRTTEAVGITRTQWCSRQ